MPVPASNAFHVPRDRTLPVAGCSYFTALAAANVVPVEPNQATATTPKKASDRP